MMFFFTWETSQALLKLRFAIHQEVDQPERKSQSPNFNQKMPWCHVVILPKQKIRSQPPSSWLSIKHFCPNFLPWNRASAMWLMPHNLLEQAAVSEVDCSLRRTAAKRFRSVLEIDRGLSGAGGETALTPTCFWFKRFCKMDRGPKQSHEDGVMKCCWLCRWKVKMWVAEWNVMELGDRAEIRESLVVRWSELPHQHPASPLCWWCCCG